MWIVMIKQVTIQAADSAFKTLVSLQERLAAWYKEKKYFLWYYSYQCNYILLLCMEGRWRWRRICTILLCRWLWCRWIYWRRWSVSTKIRRRKHARERKVLCWQYDDEIDYADEFVPFMDAVELDYFNPDPTSYESVTTRNPSVSSSSSTTSSVNNGHQHKGGKKYPQRAPRMHQLMRVWF